MGRILVRSLDRLVSRSIGVFEFSDDPGCILRLQLAKTRHSVSLPGLDLIKGDYIIKLHLWNEHLPPIVSNGPDLSWARHFLSLFIRSMQQAAAFIKQDSTYNTTRALGGETSLPVTTDFTSGRMMMQRLGFTVLPWTSPLGRFGEFWENFYATLLLWTYNPASLQNKRWLGLHRMEIWMPMEAFFNRYVKDA